MFLGGRERVHCEPMGQLVSPVDGGVDLLLKSHEKIDGDNK